MNFKILILVQFFFIKSFAFETVSLDHCDGILDTGDMLQIQNFYDIYLDKSKIKCFGDPNVCEKSQIPEIGCYWNKKTNNIGFSKYSVTTEGYTYMLNPILDCKSYFVNNVTLYERSSCMVYIHPQYIPTYISSLIQFYFFSIIFTFAYELFIYAIYSIIQLKTKFYPIGRRYEYGVQVNFITIVLGLMFIIGALATIGKFDN